ncbi:MAG: ABC transporter permease [Alphaproteobacteria bacterium]|nr:ABC transporter permease [Alphaproteobacteria bacterium]
MLAYIVRRVLIMIPTLLAISAISFIIIELPPGDFLSTMAAELQSQGEAASLEKLEYLREQYGLDRPPIEQYFRWLFGLLQGDLGWSFEHNVPVAGLIGERLVLSFLVALSTLLFSYIVAFPIGVYSATHQYSWGDYIFTFIGFIGLATPSFLLALVLMYLANIWFDTSIGGLMDEQYLDQPMSWAKLRSVLEHLWIPMVVIGLSSAAENIRLMRANLLDELQKQYVVTARAKGLSDGRLLVKYPLRMALNPFIADIGGVLPRLISGSAIVSVVMSLPINGPMLVRALQSQDMYLAGSFVMLEAVLVVVGVFLSDLALAALDPRIRLGGSATR